MSPARATPARSTARASWRRCWNGCSGPTPRRSSGSSSGWRSSTSRRCAAREPTRTSSCWSRCASQVGKLRRALAAHRSALVALTHPELEALGDNASGERFQSLFTRFESTLQEARDAREAIVGSFDVLIARGGHHTNQIMKVLTLTSVILLPGALIAGVMGMNFKVGLFDNPTLFWVVIAAIIAVAPLTIGIAKLRHWI